MFRDCKYTRWYDQIVAIAKMQHVDYGERHHIIPKSLGGSDHPSNIVKLTFRQHFVCHQLLVKMTEGTNQTKMRYALYMLRAKSKNHVRPLTSHQYAIVKRAGREIVVSDETRKKMSLGMIGKNKGKKSSDQTRKKMSEIAKNRPTVSQSTREKISARLREEWANGVRSQVGAKAFATRQQNGFKGSMYGKSHSEETKKKMSESAKKQT